MTPYYYEELPTAINEEEMLIVGLVVLGVLAVVLLFALVFAILRAVGLYTIAKRRGIAHAWLSWIPIGNAWILGSLADQYQHLALGQIKSRRKILLALQFVTAAVTITIGAVNIMAAVAEMNDEFPRALAMLNMVPSLVSSVVSIATLVFYHVCNYDLYRSCDPKNAVVFLVLGIIIPVTEPFFYLACRRKDLGMPQPERIVPEPFGPEL